MNIKYLRLCSCGGGGVRCTPGGAQSCLGGGGRVARGGSCAQAAERETPTRYTNAISPDFHWGDCLVIVASDGGGVRLGLLILWFWWFSAELGNRHSGDNGDLMALMIILMVMEMVFLMVMAMEMVLLLVMAMMAMMTVMAILVILGWFSHRRNSGRHTPGNAPRTSLSSSSSYSPRTTLGVNHCHHLQYYNKKMHPFTFLGPCLYF